MEHVEGTLERGEVVLFALSTCVWCKKTRALLEELGVTYDYEYVDLASRARQQEIEAEITARVERPAYPTLCTAERCVVGYRPDAIKELLEL
jgi:glutaredoxin-like protein NrdH